jgi:hypothetical protein
VCTQVQCTDLQLAFQGPRQQVDERLRREDLQLCRRQLDGDGGGSGAEDDVVAADGHGEHRPGEMRHCLRPAELPHQVCVHVEIVALDLVVEAEALTLQIRAP